MFDRYFVDARGRVGERVGSINMEVVERRAPTDDSVRLLREMEGQARAAVLASIPLESNTFKGEMLVTALDHKPALQVTILFEFNGRRCKAVAEIEKADFRVAHGPVNGVGKKIQDAIAETLVSNILGDVLTPEAAARLARL